MFSDNKLVSVRQIQALIILNMLGVLFVTLPKFAISEFGGFGWLVVLVVTGLVGLYAAFITWVGNRCTDCSFGEFIYATTGRFFGSIILIGFYVKIIIGTAIWLRIFAEVISYNLLLKTPVIVISGVFMVACYYAASCGYEARGRVAEILLYFVILTVVLIFMFSFNGLEFKNVLSNGYNENGDFIEIVGYSFLLFNGLELLLMAMPNVNKRKNVQKDIFNAVLLLGGLLVMMTVVTTAYFGVEKTKNVIFPVIEMMNSVDFKFSFAQKQDLIIMGLWIATMFGAVNAGVFFSSQVIKEVFEMDIKALFLSSALILALSSIPKDIAQVFDYLEIYTKSIGMVYFIGLPTVIAVCWWIGKRRCEV